VDRPAAGSGRHRPWHPRAPGAQRDPELRRIAAGAIALAALCLLSMPVFVLVTALA
jgi:hypothetical protein